jgi:hypothetical protein
MIFKIFMNIKTNPTNNSNIYTNFMCFIVIICYKYKKGIKKSNVIYILIYFSTDDSQCIFVKIADSFLIYFLVTIKMFYQTLHTYL